MPAVALNHYTILVQDLERTKDFYEDIVGLKAGDRPPLTFPGYWLYCGGEPVVHLIGYRPEDPKIEGAPDTGRLDHIAFHAEFFRERLAVLPPWRRTLWRAQFRVSHAAAAIVVAWDHRSCFKALGVGPFDFLRQASGPVRRFLRRLEKPHTLWAVPSGPLPAEPLST